MDLNEIQAKEVSLNTSSGDINVERSEVEKRLSINSLSGDLMLQNLKAETLQRRFSEWRLQYKAYRNKISYVVLQIGKCSDE